MLGEHVGSDAPRGIAGWPHMEPWHRLFEVYKTTGRKLLDIFATAFSP
jgi:hypothetical protein